LSAIKTSTGSSVQGDRLSLHLSRARLRFTGTSANVLSRLPRFFVLQLPAALYRIRWLTLAVTAATALLGVLYAWWAISTPQALVSYFGASPEELEQYATEDFISYYSNDSEASFTSFVWTNNAWLCAQCIIFGVTGLYPVYLLFSNAQSLGMTAAVLEEFDNLDVFFLYIAPHGQLELYNIFVAGAAGLAIFWSWISPGPRSRLRALAEEGRALFTVVVGLVLSMLVCGLIEGYITRQDWPWPIKIGIGTVALAAFLLYQWAVGRRAAKAGETGDLEEFESGARQIIAA
jgi:uncharacterized membrane protein SpoIIM required for sporulation